MIWTWELWARGHRFVRYADDVRVFVRSERAAQRVFESVCGVIERRLKLKVNRGKSSIRHAAQATLLGFGFFLTGSPVRIRVAPTAVKRRKDQLRILTRRSWGVSMEYGCVSFPASCSRLAALSSFWWPEQGVQAARARMAPGSWYLLRWLRWCSAWMWKSQ